MPSLNFSKDKQEEAEYQGRKVTLNRPFRTPDGPKKFSVYVKDGDKVKKVNFGDEKMAIQRDNPERRKNFRARHKCDQKKDKTKAGYWSCKFWSTKSVTDLLKGEDIKKINENLEKIKKLLEEN